jgi:hypothetical protein
MKRYASGAGTATSILPTVAAHAAIAAEQRTYGPRAQRLASELHAHLHQTWGGLEQARTRLTRARFARNIRDPGTEAIYGPGFEKAPLTC